MVYPLLAKDLATEVPMRGPEPRMRRMGLVEAGMVVVVAVVVVVVVVLIMVLSVMKGKGIW